MSELELRSAAQSRDKCAGRDFSQMGHVRPQVENLGAASICIDCYDAHPWALIKKIPVITCAPYCGGADNKYVNAVLFYYASQTCNAFRFTSELQVGLRRNDVSDDVGQHSWHPCNQDPHLRQAIRHLAFRQA